MQKSFLTSLSLSLLLSGGTLFGLPNLDQSLLSSLSPHSVKKGVATCVTSLKNTPGTVIASVKEVVSKHKVPVLSAAAVMIIVGLALKYCPWLRAKCGLASESAKRSSVAMASSLTDEELDNQVRGLMDWVDSLSPQERAALEMDLAQQLADEEYSAH